MSFAVVLEGMSIVAYIIVLGGGKRLRENGWRILSLLIILSAVVQAAGMSLVVSSAPVFILARWKDERQCRRCEGNGLAKLSPL